MGGNSFDSATYTAVSADGAARQQRFKRVQTGNGVSFSDEERVRDAGLDISPGNPLGIDRRTSQHVYGPHELTTIEGLVAGPAAAVTEADIVAAGADKGPRITPRDIEALIADEVFYHPGRDQETLEDYAGPSASIRALTLLTVCILVLKNGYTVVGKSACASPENFNVAIGRQIAREDAVRQIWALEGYALRNRLSAT